MMRPAKALWRLLYETAARAGEALSLNVEDVEVANQRAVVVSRGGFMRSCLLMRICILMSK
jgi:integrase